MPRHNAEPMSNTSFRGIGQRPSGRYAVEILCDKMRHWLGTFETRAYDTVAWRYR